MPVRVGVVGLPNVGKVTFLTANAQDCHAWATPRGTTARQAAGVVHTDFARGFIKAEVIHWDDLAALGPEAAVRQAGRLHVEGKDYVIQDGDVVFVRFNVS